MKTKHNTENVTIESALNDLLEKYPKGIPNPSRRYGPAYPGSKLSHEEVQKLLEHSNGNLQGFSNLLQNNKLFLNLISGYSNQLILNYFNKLVAHDKYRNNRILQKQRAQLERVKRQQALKKKRERQKTERAELRRQQRTKEIEILRKEREKAKKRMKLKQQLNLSAEQKKILKLLAL